MSGREEWECEYCGHSLWKKRPSSGAIDFSMGNPTQKNIYRQATGLPWLGLGICSAGLVFMVWTLTKDTGWRVLSEPFMFLWGAMILLALIGGIVASMNSIRTPFVVRIGEAGLEIDGNAIPFEAVRNLTRVEHSYGGEGDIRPLLEALLPRVVPSTDLELEYESGGKRARVTILSIPDWQDLEKHIRDQAKYLSVMTDTTEGAVHEWDLERIEILDALASPDPADKAFAKDLLSKYAELGNHEAADILRQHDDDGQD